MAGVFSSTSTYVELADGAALTLANTGWMMQFFVYPNSSVGGSTFQYIYSHGQPQSFLDAINLFRIAGGTTMRLIIDWAGGTLFDLTTTTALLTLDTWNTVVLAYNGTNIYIGVGANGSSVVEIGSPPALPATNPAGVARIGQSSWTTAGTRWWVGRIAQAFKSDIVISLTEVTRLAASFISPGFFPATSAWQVPMWCAPSFDWRGMLVVTDVSMSFGADGPWILPSSEQNSGVFDSALVVTNTWQYERLG